jgi:arsenite-transporting ATPase
MSSGRHRPAVPERLARLRTARLLLICGKGGVGKTTVAAALALRIARDDRTRRVLLISTDPAHSAADVLAAQVNATPTRVFGAGENLRAREIDAPGLLAERRREVMAAADDIAASVGAVGRVGIAELLELAPPGIDELLAMIEVANVAAASDSATATKVTKRQLVVLDMAPTGHAIRLLQMPEAAREWVQVILRLLLKYKDIVRPGRVASELVAMGRSIRLLKDLLVDPERTCGVLVTRAEEAPRLETVRLREQLAGLGIAAPIVVINALTLAPAACRRCGQTAAAERLQRSAMERACRRHGCAIILTPLAAPPPRGIAALLRWSDAWAQAGTS